MNHLTTEAQQTQDVDVFAEAATHFITHCKADTPLWAASRLKDLHRTEDETRTLMMELYNPRCANPSSDETERAITDTYNAQSVAPVHVTNSQITGTDPFSITIGIGYGDNHSDNANRFKQEWYPAKTLRVSEEVFYWYDGKKYNAVNDKAIETAVAMALLNTSPSASQVSGTFKMVKALSNGNHQKGVHPTRGSNGLILMNNGILDVNTNELLPHSSEYFSTNLIPFDYEPTATAPAWETFLNSTFEGDQERINFIEEWIGYNLTRDYSHQKIALMIGKQRSGKSTITKILEAIQGGDNYGTTDMDGLASDSKLHMLSDKLSIVMPDASNPSRGSSGQVISRLKSISGCDTISYDRKFISATESRFPGKLTLVTNNVLNLQDDSGALANRFIICPFNKSFLGKEDHTLEARLMAEIPGIINRCIAALNRLQKRGYFVEPKASQQWRDDVQDRANPLAPFIREHCEFVEDERVHADQVLTLYKQWCIAEGMRPVTRTAFFRMFNTALPINVEHKKAIRIDGVNRSGYVGLKLCKDAAENLQQVLAHSNVSMFKQSS